MSGTVSETEHKGEVIYDNEAMTVWYHRDAKIVHHKLHKFIRGDAFRQAMLKGTEALLLHGAKKWLSDDRLLSVLPPEDQEWAQQEWFPRARQAGWKYWAIAKPEMAVADLSVRRHAAIWTASGVLTAVFATPAQGLTWLRGVETAPPSQPQRRRRTPRS